MVVMNEPTENSYGPCLGKITSLRDELSFNRALNKKYVDQEDFDEVFIVPKDASISTDITYVGFKGITNIQKQLRQLVSIDLSGFGIRESGDIHKVKGFLDRVTVLNLAENLLGWQDVIHILGCLPRLKEIILTANNLRSNEDIKYPDALFRNLTSIVLGKTNIDWRTTIATLSRIWVQIDHIDLWDSQLTDESMQLPAEFQHHPFVKQVKSLALSQNHFTGLSWVTNIGQLDSLLELDVSRCKLTSLGVTDRLMSHLKNLKVLNISYNDITCWQEVSRLDSLPSLTSLICNDNPFYITDKYARSHTTACLGNLLTLNRETITGAFRRDSEILYLKNFFSDYASFVKGANENFRNAHPRYERLVGLYGVLGDLTPKISSSDDKFVTVMLCHGESTVTKKVPRDMRVSNLKMICKAVFKLRSLHGIEIVCCDANPSNKELSYPLDQDGQTLHFFSVEDGQRLIIKKADE